MKEAEEAKERIKKKKREAVEKSQKSSVTGSIDQVIKEELSD